MRNLPILIVEIDEPLGQYIAHVASQAGYKPLVANSLITGLRLVASKAYSIILADYFSPVEQLLYRWPAIHLLARFAPQTPLVAITALDSVPIGGNVVGMLRMPFGENELLQELKKHATIRPRRSPEPLLAKYLAALWESNIDAAAEAVEEAKTAGCDAKKIYEGLFAAALFEIGDLWGADSCTVADEHGARAITELLMAGVAAATPSRPIKGRNVLVSCMNGEYHEIGARMVADFFRWDGWTVRFLGSNTPEADVVAESRRRQVQVVALSATMRPSWGVMKAQVAALREAGVTAVILGGQAIRSMEPESIAALGALGKADTPEEGVELANEAVS